MKRRTLLKTAGGIGAVGVAGCLDNGNENGDNDDGTPNGDENGDDGNGDENDDEPAESGNGDAGETRTDTGDEDGFSWTFEVTRLEAGNNIDDADIDFDRDENRAVVEGTTYGGNLCQTAELGSADILSDVGEDNVRQLDVSVTTRDVEGAGDICAEAIREIDYTATFEFEDETQYPNRVNVSHDGRTVTGAAWDSATESPPEEDS